MKEPLVSVLMAVRNGEAYIVDAIASIIEQTFGDWELICVNDGSEDGTAAILDQFATMDERIRVVHQANQGLYRTLKTATDLARGPLMCRMDCDDIALPDRLEKCVAWMRNHPRCVVVGGAVLEMDSEGRPLRVARCPSSHSEIEEALLHRRTGHFNPATMFRTSAFQAVGGYREEFQWVEDHDLWLRLSQVGELHNMLDILLCYRLHAASICWSRSAQQRQMMNDLLREAYRLRNLEMPQSLWKDADNQRSAAGPGKWARIAARGGFPRSMVFHLRKLSASQERPIFKLRMIAECILRAPIGYLKGWFRNEQLSVPAFPQWQERFASSEELINSSSFKSGRVSSIKRVA